MADISIYFIYCRLVKFAKVVDDLKPWAKKEMFVDNNYILFKYYGCKRIGLICATPSADYHTSTEVISYINTNIKVSRIITTTNVLNNAFGINVSRYPHNINLGDMNNGRFFYLSWPAGTDANIILGMVGSDNVTKMPVFYGYAIII